MKSSLVSAGDKEVLTTYSWTNSDVVPSSVANSGGVGMKLKTVFSDAIVLKSTAVRRGKLKAILLADV